MVNLISWLYFFVGATMGLTIELVIKEAMSIMRKIAVGFSGLSL